MFIRKNYKTVHTLNKVLQYIEANKDNRKYNDQTAFSQVYKMIPLLFVTLLPRDQYPNGRIYFDLKQSKNPKMLHCNYLHTTAEKEERLKEHNLWNPEDDAFILVSKYDF